MQVARETFPKASVLQFDDDAQAFQEVINGNAHAVIASSPNPSMKASNTVIRCSFLSVSV